MTPCEKLGYKVGDRFEVIEDVKYAPVKAGTIIVLVEDDGSGCPWFSQENQDDKYAIFIISKLATPIRPLKTEAERRGAKFGTMGVIKATGERVVFQKEVKAFKPNVVWLVLTVRGIEVSSPEAIRLDHEPEYKEIPFSEATDDQRMQVENLVHRHGHRITQIFRFDNGVWVYTLAEYEWTGTNTDLITVRVPA